MKAGTAEVYQHEMPGGQYTNLRQQAKSLHLEGRWHEVADAYTEVNQLLGDIVKVTPSSKVVGDLALFLVTNSLKAADLLDPSRKLNLPRSVVEMLQGGLGQPEGGWPRQIQKVVLDAAGVKPFTARPGSKLPRVDLKAAEKELATKIGRAPRDVEVMSYLMYPQVFLDYEKFVKLYDNTSVIPTPAFLFGMTSGGRDQRRDRARQNADHPVSHHRRRPARRAAHRLLRIERPAQGSERARPVARGDRRAKSQGRSGQHQSRPRPDARKNLRRHRHKRPEN